MDLLNIFRYFIVRTHNAFGDVFIKACTLRTVDGAKGNLGSSYLSYKFINCTKLINYYPLNFVIITD